MRRPRAKGNERMEWGGEGWCKGITHRCFELWAHVHETPSTRLGDLFETHKQTSLANESYGECE